MLQRISDLIGRHRIFLITAHERLDGDALGSELALYHLLARDGKGGDRLQSGRDAGELPIPPRERPDRP